MYAEEESYTFYEVSIRKRYMEGENRSKNFIKYLTTRDV